MIRVNVTVRGELVDYIEKQAEKTAMSKAQILLNLAYLGYDKKELKENEKDRH